MCQKHLENFLKIRLSQLGPGLQCYQKQDPKIAIFKHSSQMTEAAHHESLVIYTMLTDGNTLFTSLEKQEGKNKLQLLFLSQSIMCHFHNYLWYTESTSIFVFFTHNSQILFKHLFIQCERAREQKMHKRESVRVCRLPQCACEGQNTSQESFSPSCRSRDLTQASKAQFNTSTNKL